MAVIDAERNTNLKMISFLADGQNSLISRECKMVRPILSIKMLPLVCTILISFVYFMYLGCSYEEALSDHVIHW